MGQHCCRHSSLYDASTTSMGSTISTKQPCQYIQTKQCEKLVKRKCDLESGMTFQFSVESDECPITLQSLTQLVSQDDLVITWCCHTCMSRSALKIWLSRSSENSCPHCRSSAVIPQIFGQKPAVFDGAHTVHLLIKEGRSVKCIQDLLLNVPASLYAADCLNRTPLHYAIMAGRFDVVKLLCDCGADLDSADDDGNAPLFLAVQCRSPSIVKLLMSRKASGQIKRACDLIRRSTGIKDNDHQEWMACLEHSAALK